MKAYQAIIVGSGFSGLGAAIKLKQQGITDILILERRSFYGGTWCQNTYPGAAVDVPSPLYSYSFEPYAWTRMFAKQEELKEYTLHIIEKYQLHKKIQLNSTVKKMVWLADESLWEVEDESGASYKAQFVINATGQLSEPVSPAIQGIDGFKGEVFHTNMWDHSVDYKNKTVAVVGNAASAVQVIPAIADDVKALHIFQRSAHWHLIRRDFAFPEKLRQFLTIKPVYYALRYVLYCAFEMRFLSFRYAKKLLAPFLEWRSRRFMSATIKDKALKEKLTPDYRIGCKRVLLTNEYYQALNKNNVFLHDKTDSIDHIHSDSITTKQGSKIEADIIVFATGFDTTNTLVPYEVIGEEGVSLSSYWGISPHAYQGTTIPHFPNFFTLTGPNSITGHTSVIFIIESQLNYVMKAIQQVSSNPSVQSISVTESAEKKYMDGIYKNMDNTIWASGGCNSWYKNEEGKIVMLYPDFTFFFYYENKKFKLEDHRLG